MSYSIVPTERFFKDAKRLKKKFPSLKEDLSNLECDLLENPILGTSIGDDCYKIRLAIKSKGKGKRGGARVITNVKIVDEIIYLLSIYDKSEKSDIDDDELKSWIANL